MTVKMDFGNEMTNVSTESNDAKHAEAQIHYAIRADIKKDN